MDSRSVRAQGFTIIELMIVLLIAGVLLAVGIPSFQTMIKNNRIVSTTNELLGAIKFARVEAMSRGRDVHVGAGSGSVGWVVWLDGSGANDDAWDPGEEIRVWSAPSNTISIAVGGGTFTVFNSTGFPSAANDFTVCDDRTGEDGNTVDLLASGVLVRATVLCP